MDLVKLIAKKVGEIESTGKLEEIIEKYTLECLDRIVRSSFDWNGEAKKQIEEALVGKLGICLERVKIPQYQKAISDIVNNRLNNSVIDGLQKEIGATIDKITGTLDKKEWKLSEIIEQFVEFLDKSYDGEMESQYGECSLHIKQDGNCVHISFDRKEDTSSYRCENRLFVYKNKLAGITIDNKPFSPFEARSMDSFEEFMFKLYCSNVNIIIDSSACELEYHREDCD